MRPEGWLGPSALGLLQGGHGGIGKHLIDMVEFTVERQLIRIGFITPGIAAKDFCLWYTEA